MNNPLGLVYKSLPGTLPLGSLISAAQLRVRDDWATEREALLAATRAEAARLRDQLSQEIEQARKDAEGIITAARQEAQSISREARDTAIADAVQWLCSEQDIEQHIARHLTQRWRSLTAHILRDLLGQCDQNELVLRQVEHKMSAGLAQGGLTLFVAPAALATAKLKFEGITQLEIVTDASLATGQARLESSLVRIHLDAPKHQASLLNQLTRDGLEMTCLK